MAEFGLKLEFCFRPVSLRQQDKTQIHWHILVHLGPRGPGFALSFDEDGQKTADQLDILDVNVCIAN
jgi:hypothetical protein